jgi:hypothetical protein
VRVNKLYVRSNLANFPRKDEEWIADVFYIPTPVAQPDSDRPFVPYMLVIASQDTGLILGHQVFDPRKIELTFAEEFVKIIKSKGYLPSQLWIARHESRLWFEEIAENIQLPLDADPDSPVIEEIKLGLFGSFSV